MEKNIGALAIILVILCLIVGFTAGYVMKDEKIVYEDKIVKVPYNVTVEKVVEIVKEITSTDTQPLLDTAIVDYLEEVEDEKDLQYCGEERYDKDQIKVSDVDDDYTINYEEDSYEVVFEIELKYLDKDVEEKCYVDNKVSAYYEDDEDVEITILE